MKHLDRFYKIDFMLQHFSVVTREKFLRELDISRATLNRTLDFMRDRFNAPISWSREKGGYFFDKNLSCGPRYQLPSLWFNSEEIYSLLITYQLLSQMQSGFLENQIRALKVKIEKILAQSEHSAKEITSRIRIFRHYARPLKSGLYQKIAKSVLERRQIRIIYSSRSKGEETTRIISPQRLVYYRDNWYLDAWCHLRKNLRSFSLDKISIEEIIKEKAKDISEAQLDRVLGSGYGIFSGEEVQWAHLLFSPESARWVSVESWHPQQKSWEDSEGYHLEIPYADDRELIRDIMSYGNGVRVVGPNSLREQVVQHFKESLKVYQ